MGNFFAVVKKANVSICEGPVLLLDQRLRLVWFGPETEAKHELNVPRVVRAFSSAADPDVDHSHVGRGQLQRHFWIILSCEASELCHQLAQVCTQHSASVTGR